MNSLTCPKCHGQMRQYERNGVTVDQCTECRGIFLDRGELERLVSAEDQWAGQYAGGPPGYQQPRYGDRRHRDDDDDDWDDDDDDRRRSPSYGGHHERPYKKRKKSFLEGLFDD
jgi:Zn-finger nucleic acid-binding protein